MLMNRNCEISSIPKSSLFLARIPLTYKTPIDSSTNTRKKKKKITSIERNDIAHRYTTTIIAI